MLAVLHVVGVAVVVFGGAGVRVLVEVAGTVGMKVLVDVTIGVTVDVRTGIPRTT